MTKQNLKGAHVMTRAIVCANATLLPGVVIGVHAIVGAGSVVTRSVGAGEVVAGNPARKLKEIDDLPYNIRTN